MNLDTLIVTQHRLRVYDQLPGMVEFVLRGGFWTKEVLCRYADERCLLRPPLIEISEFEDGLFYAHDGHHRLTATLMGGRQFLHTDEYRVTRWTYQQYLEINLTAGWMTPFDPRTRCRKHDISPFKAEITKLASDPRVEEIIRNRLNDYTEPRRFTHLSGLFPEGHDVIAKQP